MSDGMFVYCWEYRVRPGAEREFTRHYGPDGTWVRLFRRGVGHLGTELLRDRGAPDRYLTIDRWVNEAAFREFRERFAAEFDELDQRCAQLTISETVLGDFAVARHEAFGSS
jgi:heme-degrading monooxygenase HmoA